MMPFLSDQHVDMSDARAARDLLDVKKLSVWLKNHNPFDENDPRLKSLSSGKVSETKITCEIAEDIGKKIWNMTIKEYQDKFDGLQGEDYYDEMPVCDLDSTLEAVNDGKLSHTISN